MIPCQHLKRDGIHNRGTSSCGHTGGTGPFSGGRGKLNKQLCVEETDRGRSNNHNIAKYAKSSMSTLLLPLNIRNQLLEAIIDTGSTYSLIQESLWNQIKHVGEVLQ